MGPPTGTLTALYLMMSSREEMMAELPRLNGIIKALEEGQVAFVGSGPADAQAGTNAPYDGVLFEMEHGPYDIRALQIGRAHV